MHRLGKSQDWNDERGCGFIAPLESAGDAGRASFHSTFFHIGDYQQQGRRPESGELVKYVADARAMDDGRRRG